MKFSWPSMARFLWPTKFIHCGRQNPFCPGIFTNFQLLIPFVGKLSILFHLDEFWINTLKILLLCVCHYPWYTMQVLASNYKTPIKMYWTYVIFFQAKTFSQRPGDFPFFYQCQQLQPSYLHWSKLNLKKHRYLFY